MNFCVLKLVFVLVVETDAVLVDVAHDRRFPGWTPQELDNKVEHPVLRSQAGNVRVQILVWALPFFILSNSLSCITG